MRLVLDLQAAQGSNKSRGIGRYSLALARAMARRWQGGDLMIALNGRMEESVDALRQAFRGLVPDDNIRVWQGMTGLAATDPDNDWRRRASEQVREAFLASLKPDVVHTASLFEGFDDDVVTSVGAFTRAFGSAATLYDLIPLVHREIYLRHPGLEKWYANKLSHLQRADLWLAISEHSRKEAIELLGLPGDSVVRIGGAADSRFQPLQLPSDLRARLRAQYGLTDSFLMYTGGIDHRKNIDGLMRAFALLPMDLRTQYQLLIVCHADASAREHLLEFASSLGLGAREVVFSGYVPDDDLVALYNLCTAFVFPSWHEGLGLPALEAMACGAAVVASDCSSLPEVIGRSDALFDPRDPKAIAGKLTQVLRDSGFREDLRAHALKQAAAFSWDESARLALEAFEDLHNRRQAGQRTYSASSAPHARPHLVMVTPLPPERSGIADYSADLLPALARHYDIDVVVDQAQVKAPAVEATCRIRDVAWFEANADRCERIVYQFGNSHFHKHMLGMLERHPGVVVLHDFFLSGLSFHMEVNNHAPDYWSQALFESHGYRALVARFAGNDAHKVMADFPVNFPVIRNATGVVVHSEFARELAAQWYGSMAADWVVIPQVRALEGGMSRAAARQKLGIAEGDFLVCSFGILAPTKLNHRLLQAWLASKLRSDQRAHLAFVGDHHGSEYGQGLLKTIRNGGLAGRVRIVGFCANDDYRVWLAAADAAVQLRKSTRGETSRAVLDCSSAGLALVVNAHGTMRDFPMAIQLPDEFGDGHLVQALESLRGDADLCRDIGERVRTHARENNAPRVVAEGYADAIERLHVASLSGSNRLLPSLARLDNPPSDERSWAQLAHSVASSLPTARPARQLLVDVSALAAGAGNESLHRHLRRQIGELASLPGAGFCVEPIARSGNAGGFNYVRAFTCRLLGLPDRILPDGLVEFAARDVYLNPFPDGEGHVAPFLTDFRRRGGLAYLLLDGTLDGNNWAAASGHRAGLSRILRHLDNSDGVVCRSRETAMRLLDLLDVEQPPLTAPLWIGFLDDPADAQYQPSSPQGKPGLRAGAVPWQTCADLLGDASHRNWLCRWQKQESRSVALPSAAVRVA